MKASLAKLLATSRQLPMTLVIACWVGFGGILFGLALCSGARQAQTRAQKQLALASSSVAERLNVTLRRFAEVAESAGPADYSSSNRVVNTERLLRAQISMPSVEALFNIDPSGHLIATSEPFPSTAPEVTGWAWFQDALKHSGATGLSSRRLSLELADMPWSRPVPAIVITHRAEDGKGTTLGISVAVVSVERARRILAEPWLGTGTQLLLASSNGDELRLSGPASAARPVSDQAVEVQSLPPPSGAFEKGASGGFWPSGPELLTAVSALGGEPSVLQASSKLAASGARIVARMTSIEAMRVAWPDIARWLWLLSLAYFGALIGLISLRAMAGTRRPRAGDPGPAEFGSDWRITLDRGDHVCTVDGHVPPLLRDGIGKPLLDLVRDGPGSPGLERLQAALAANQPAWDVDIAFGRDDASDHFQRLEIRPQHDGSFIVLGRNVTSELRAVSAVTELGAAVRQSKEEVESTRKERDRILAAVGHDVRTPMNSIMGICSLLLDGHLEEDQRRWVGQMRHSCDVLLAMLNGLLEVSSSDSASSEIQLDSTDLADLVQEVAGAMKPQAQDKGLSLRVRVDDLLLGLWEIDPTRVRQVLINLVGNAIKFTNTGGVEIRASIVPARGVGTIVRIAVSDSGMGVPPEEREIIFDRFRRGRAQNASEGLGLGLAICRENAVLLGGQITVESTVGIGSEFTFEFPSRRIQPLTRSPLFLGRTCVLVALSGGYTDQLAKQLERLGFTVDIAGDGFVGLALAERMAVRRGALDLVVLDAGMTGMAPETFLRRLDATSHGARTKVVTIESQGQERERPRLTCDASVPEGGGMAELLPAISQVLGDHRALDAVDPDGLRASASRILIVEDDAVNRSLLSAALTRSGFSCFIAKDGEEAVRLAAHDTFDAILMDIQIPGIDGFEATRHIRDRGGYCARIPIIALTALDGAVIQKRCNEAGITAIVVKPCDLQRLSRNLRGWVASGRISDLLPHSWAGTSDNQSEAIPGEAGADLDISDIFIQAVVQEVGLDRATACVAEFVSDAEAQCARLHEFLAAWEVEAVARICHDLGGVAGTFGAVAFSEVLEELSGAVQRNAPSDAEEILRRVEVLRRGLKNAMARALQRVASTRHGGREAA